MYFVHCVGERHPRNLRARHSARATLVAALVLATLLLPLGTHAQSQQATKPQRKTSRTLTTSAQQQKAFGGGKINGTVIDKNGALAVGAKVQLNAGNDHSSKQEVVSGDNGEYAFTDIAPGPFVLTISAPGFDEQQFSGELTAGQALAIPPIMLALSAAVTEVRVGGSSAEVAEVEVQQQLEQRIFGFVPNFYVTYSQDPAPLFAKQKFKLAYRSVIDPVTLLGVGFLSGMQQAADQFHGYGQGAAGYGRRFGANYGDVIAGTFIGSALLPSVLHQDPRYIYQGTGSKKSRFAHALENAVIARNDRSKKWQPNYSGIIGSFAAAGVSYSYYPGSDRNTGAFLENSLVRIGESSVSGIIQEFVLRRFTSHAPQKIDTPGNP